MFKRQYYFNRILLIICIILPAGICFAQSCNAITLDSITNPGIYEVATLNESDNIRNGPGYAGATIYYPTNATPPFASMVIVPGYVSAESTIASWGPFLASHGIVTMTIGTNSLFDDPYKRRDALLDAIITIIEEQNRINSPLIGSLDINKIAVGGWSMGGGGAQLAAVSDTSINAVMAICPWLPEGITASDLNHPVPLLIFSGSADVVAPPTLHADMHYDFTPETTEKLIYEIENGGHSVANNPIGGQDDVGKIGLSWLKHQLVGDSCYCPLFLETPSTASKYLTNVVCPVTSNPTTFEKIEKNSLSKLFPNPCRSIINIKVENNIMQTKYEIISLAGAKISSGEIFNEVTSIDIKNLSSGVYIMNIIRPQFSERIKFVVM